MDWRNVSRTLWKVLFPNISSNQHHKKKTSILTAKHKVKLWPLGAALLIQQLRKPWILLSLRNSWKENIWASVCGLELKKYKPPYWNILHIDAKYSLSVITSTQMHIRQELSITLWHWHLIFSYQAWWWRVNKSFFCIQWICMHYSNFHTYLNFFNIKIFTVNTQQADTAEWVGRQQYCWSDHCCMLHPLIHTYMCQFRVDTNTVPVSESSQWKMNFKPSN